MRQRRVVLVQLPAPVVQAGSASGNVPLAAGCLGVAVDRAGLQDSWKVEVLHPSQGDHLGDTSLVDWIVRQQPDLLGFSLYLWNVERSLALAERVRGQVPGIHIVGGGPEINEDNEWVLEYGALDGAAFGESESTFSALLAAIAGGRDLSSIPGYGVSRNGRVQGPRIPARADFPLTEVPSPYLSGKIPIEVGRSVYVETVRGCRSHCTFCFYPRSSRSLRALDPMQAAHLVSELVDRGAREIVFLDPTFNHRSGFRELLRALGDVNVSRRCGFFAEIRAEGVDSEIVGGLVRAGFTTVEIGLQSVNRATLKKIRRGGDPEKTARVARALRREGISVLLDLMLGLPGDTLEDVRRGIDFVLEHQLEDSVQFFPLSVLPGTPMRSDAELLGLVHDSRPPYRVIRTSSMSEEEIRMGFEECEQAFGRELDEPIRPWLADPQAPVGKRIDLESDRTIVLEPGAAHSVLWMHGNDLWERRERMVEAIDRRLDLDPFCVLDVVLSPGAPFPLDLLDGLESHLSRFATTYLERAYAHRERNAQRRVVAVLAEGVEWPYDWMLAVSHRIPVVRNLDFVHATDRLSSQDGPFWNWRVLGQEGAELRAVFDRLAGGYPEPHRIHFADPGLESRWVQQVLGGGEIRETLA